ncbi:hypothetical protein FNW52_01510 [Flavobacterium sp. ZT3R18]|nr:hypothetical protein FNW52_01510 [Flavobacterium sp. ZT3R18]
MTKVIVCLIQYLVLITMQMASETAVCDELNDRQRLKSHVRKMIRVKKNEAQKELKAIEKSKNCSFGTLQRF